MKEDEVLAQLGAHVREERKDDAAFERDAAAQPLGDAAVDRIVARVVPAPAKTPARVLPFVRKAARYAAPLALAAGVVLFVATRGGAPAGPELPGYAVSASGEQAMRGETQPATRLHLGHAAGSRFEIVARPATAVGDAKVIAYAFAMEGGEPVALDAKVDVSKDGAIRVQGDARRLGDTGELRIVVGTPESIGTFEGAVDRARAGSGDDRARVLVVAIDRDR